jgi:DNA-binding Lrp family transcriptional regulator
MAQVLAAIEKGASECAAIEKATGLDETAVRNAIRRLHDEGSIRRLNFGGYAPVLERCLLAECWKR